MILLQHASSFKTCVHCSVVYGLKKKNRSGFYEVFFGMDLSIIQHFSGLIAKNVENNILFIGIIGKDFIKSI